MKQRGFIRRQIQRGRRKWRRWRADVHVISYPKCGRTWLVFLIGKSVQLRYGLGRRNLLRLRSMASRWRGIPYILQHHDGGPEFLLPERLERDKSIYRDRKVVFLVRDPRDVLVSSYFQKARRNNDYDGTLAEFVHERTGGIETIVEFFNIWAEQAETLPAFHLVTYEDMHRNTEGELRRVLDFLGIRDISDAILREAVEAGRFDNMREIERENRLGTSALAARDGADESTYKTRKGEIGGYRAYLTEADIAHLDRIIDAQLHPLYRQYWSATRDDRGA